MDSYEVIIIDSSLCSVVNIADINECNATRFPNSCKGICTNTDGSYDCKCPLGTHSDDPKNKECVPQVKLVIGNMFFTLHFSAAKTFSLTVHIYSELRCKPYSFFFDYICCFLSKK
jgi:hypothetical protein